MKRIWMASVVCSVMALGACSAEDSASFSGAETRGGADASPAPGSGLGAPSGGSSSGDGAGASSGSSAPGAEAPPQSGLLTAGVWDDNLNFDFFTKYVDLSAPALTGLPSFSAAERAAAKQKWAQRTGSTELDVTFLIDTTGSMGDELSYLQNEIDGIAQTIKTKFPQTTPRYGLVLYKDKADAYLTRWFDFKGLEEFRANLAAQTVGGGGDYPEAVAAGLDQVMKLSWRTGAVSRMTFWVADAPHHIGDEASVKASIDAAAAKDVHIYPVAASGADDRTEFTMRTAAQITGGRYIFLTDDSGIGNSHAEPHIPCYHVTKFDGALVRMVESEMAGARVAPEAEQIIRTVGNPKDGQCVTKDRGNVSIY
ncbi:MAG: VWA domain-containing protein [Labilithrix sp.]|nr:VWA domain-containing protein [Labilithrix sp.]